MSCTQCGDIVQFNEMDSHLKNSCRKRIIKCGACHGDVRFDEMDMHMNSLCPARQGQCMACGATFKASEASAHMGICPKRMVQCTMCGEQIQWDTTDHHAKNTCPYRIVACGLCGAQIRFIDQRGHETTQCPKRIVQCSSCGASMTATEITRHECMTTCSACGQSVKMNLLSHHEDNQCPMREIVCTVCWDIIRFNETSAHSAVCKPRKARGIAGFECDDDLKVHMVRPGGPANQAGMIVGDFLRRVDGQTVRTKAELAKIMLTAFEGDTKSFDCDKVAGGSITYRITMAKPPTTTGALTMERQRSVDRMKEQMGSTKQDTRRLHELLSDDRRLTNITRQIFTFCDSTNSGRLTKTSIRDLTVRFSAAAKIDPPLNEEIDKTFDQADSSRRGSISYDEWSPFLRRMFQEMEKEINKRGW